MERRKVIKENNDLKDLLNEVNFDIEYIAQLFNEHGDSKIESSEVAKLLFQVSVDLEKTMFQLGINSSLVNNNDRNESRNLITYE